MLRFKDVAKRDLVALGVDVGNWEELAEDRAGWRNALREGGEALEAPWLNKDELNDSDIVLCKSLVDFSAILCYLLLSTGLVFYLIFMFLLNAFKNCSGKIGLPLRMVCSWVFGFTASSLAFV